MSQMSSAGNEDRTTAIERALGMSLGLGILGLLEGDLAGAARMLRCSGEDLEPAVDAIRRAPSVGDPSRDELRSIIEAAVADSTERIVVKLRCADGSPTVRLDLEWSVVSEEIPGIPHVRLQVRGVERLDGGARHRWREPDANGRLPREQFIGSADLRLRRLFNARPDLIEALDRKPRDDCESGFLLQYADGDIYDGGLHQFFSNSTGNFSPWFPEFAARIGAKRKGQLVAQANLLFGDADLADRHARNACLDGFDPETDERMERLTGEYYDVMDEDVTDLFADFVQIRAEHLLS
jgi:hypothetical protein